jgi:dolichol-phosphate mannosyltransferase
MSYAPQSMLSPLTGAADLTQPVQYGTFTACAPANLLQSQPTISIVVPTRNESENIAPLLERITGSVGELAVEVIFVDDSSDDTTQVIMNVAPEYGLPTKVVARPPERRNGLGKAVVEGMRVARADWICVMDGDLQHPPEVIPQLLARAESKGATLVAASRLRAGGSVDGLSPRRQFVSHALALTSRVAFPKRLHEVTDPLTGFFLVRRELVDFDSLQPEGFKILLEILVRTPSLVIAEVPFAFGARQHGTSKANTTEVVRLAKQMFKLAVSTRRHLLKFLAVGISGIFINSLLLFLFTDLFNIHYLVSAILATEGSTAWNFAWTEAWVFRDRPQDGYFWARAAGFFVINNVLLLLRGPLLAVGVEWLGMHYLLANLVAITVMTVLRFVVADRLLWRSNGSQAKPAASPENGNAEKGNNRNMTGGKTLDTGKAYYYNIHDIVRVRSVQRLPELSYFRSAEPLTDVDIDVKVAFDVAAHQTPGSIYYREGLGRFGFAIVVDQSTTPINVVASKLVGFSPHVLYTNVVEPLLRWTFARKGYALMHGACIAQDGTALFITARTDTGKTTTILRTLRENTGDLQFLSDDMSIFSSDGVVRCYPKPLTISSHTLQAMGGTPLKWHENAFLQLQSRLHSRSGRRFAMLISTLHLPAATINAIVQIIVPPPKFMVDRLIPGAQYTREAQIAQIVVIERGGDYQLPLEEAEKFATLIGNAEDAYGFPPYPQIALRLSSWEGADLHAVEQKIVNEAVQETPALRMGSTTFDWHKRLPSVAKANGGSSHTAEPGEGQWLSGELGSLAAGVGSAD